MKKLNEKKQIVEELKQKLSTSNIVIFTDYRGLKVKEINELRGRLRAVGVEYKVVKNTLTELAIKEVGPQELLEHFDGPNALVFGTKDPVEPTKIIFDFLKTHKNLEVKMAVLEGKVISVDEVKALSALPSRAVLVAKVLGGLQAPIYGLAYVLQANIAGLVRALDAVRAQKEAS